MARRRRSWLWFLGLFALMTLVFWGATRLVDRVVLGRSGGVSSRTVLQVELVGPVVERAAALWGNSPVGPPALLEIDRALRAAADDPRVVGAIVRVGPLLTGIAKAQEIRSAIRAFRDSGKPVVAFLEIGTLTDVYVAAAADTVVQIPTGNLILGMVSRRQYYRELLDKLGVEFDTFHTGPYKTAGDAYTETTMSDEERAAIESLLDSVYDQIVGEIAADRELTTNAVRAVLDRGLLSAAEAMESGLVDEVGFSERVHELAGGGRVTSMRSYWSAAGEDGFAFLRPVIAIVHVDGAIIPGSGGGGLFGDGFAGAERIARSLRRARDEAAVQAIVLRVDSPGGAVTSSDIIWRAVASAAESKPVIVSMSDVAASGGYWIATAGHRILADGATFTGSIGVVMTRFNLAGAYEKVGIGNSVVARGANAQLLVDSHRLTEGERAVFQASIEATYREFLEKVAEARDLTVEEVEALASGRVWTGVQALENGLIDEIGGLRSAISEARRDAGISARASVRVRSYPQSEGVFGQFFDLLAARAASAPLDLPLGADRWRREAARLAHLSQGGVAWALLDAPLPAPIR